MSPSQDDQPFRPGLPPTEPFDPPIEWPPRPVSPDPAPAPEPSDNAEYAVWYGTNRQPLLDNGKLVGYSEKRDSMTHLGQCRVFIPKSHKIGSVGSHWWKRFFGMEDDRLKLVSIAEMERLAYWGAVRAALQKEGVEDRSAVVFIHGYNVSFEDSVVRAAQIGFDLSIRGAMAVFSWPSRGAIGSYTVDEATVEASEEAITEFLIGFADQSGASSVHVIAHSMGNRSILRAVNRIAAAAERQSGRPFSQIILAAADVDAGTFRNLCGAFGAVAERTTLYVSSRDIAVEASRWLHDFPRAGLMPPVFVFPGIDTINVRNADLTVLGHGYVAGARGVLTDIYELIRRGTPPSARFGLGEAHTANGEKFWVIRA